MRNILLLTILLMSTIWFTSCKGLKAVSHSTATTDSVRVRDSVVYQTVIITKDSTVIKDTVLRIKESTATITIPVNSTADTAIKSGQATIRRTVNNGMETLSASCSELAIEVNDLRTVYHLALSERDSLSKIVSASVKTSTETTVLQKSDNWFIRTWRAIKDYFAWFGLIAVVFLIFKIAKKFIV